ncbi:MAG: hypothetical protein RQ714_02935 [Nitrosomonas sp.]|nr:hypothetical protein [Nitrosomonas sp.]
MNAGVKEPLINNRSAISFILKSILEKTFMRPYQQMSFADAEYANKKVTRREKFLD